MRLLRILVLVTVCFIAGDVYSQAVQFSGKILSQKNEPLAGANIIISPSSKMIITDAEGKFVVSLTPGTKYSFFDKPCGI